MIMNLYITLCIALFCHAAPTEKGDDVSGSRKYGEKCASSADCGYDYGFCDEEKFICVCDSEYSVTDRVNKCDKAVPLEGSCKFNEQCETLTSNSECKNGVCSCIGNGEPYSEKDGTMNKCLGKQFGDHCESNEECVFKGAVCEPTKRICQCQANLTITNHIDKCGNAVKMGDYCFFNEQCEHNLFESICLNGACSCRSLEWTPVTSKDGTIKCVVINEPNKTNYTDPAMILVLSVMFLMFVIICVVLHLFSKARWNENRTIFNTPNARLMNVSLRREKKSERRGSKGSVANPSRAQSIVSLRQQSPSSESRNGIHRKESRGGSNGASKIQSTAKNPLLSSEDVEMS